ncbi:Transcription-repair-coupling factor [Poriferisphaera corsica]|uniref:Transcription-repair-coupling factor n=1 Tax=Poriferisphaera corsica TaxID=2528020 RepID=A0A517YRW2_9BACT|nr:transcription-repair coupling factor [Poriferisphaera corsica]QDU32959.1 Transcription-repair-coupling factor [Poriferisphaera corsica]
MSSSTSTWLDQLLESRQFRALIDLTSKANHIVANGSRGSSTNLLAAALAEKTKRPTLLVVAHLDEADDALDDFDVVKAAGFDLTTERFGALEVLPGESNISIELLGERLHVVSQLVENNTPDLIVAPIQALMQSVPLPEKLADFTLVLEEGLILDLNALINWLANAGYTRQDAIDQPGDFSVRGGIIDIYPPAGSIGHTPKGPNQPLGPIRLDYFGDEIERINQIDPETLGSKDHVKIARIVGASADQIQANQLTTSLIDLLPEQTIVVMHETVELSEQARGYYERLTSPSGIFSPNATFGRLNRKTHIEVTQYAARTDTADRVDLPIQQLVPFDNDAKSAIRQLGHLTDSPNNTVHVLCRKQGEADRLAELTQELIPDHAHLVNISLGSLHRGFVWADSDDLLRDDAHDTTSTKTRRLSKARKHKLAAQSVDQSLHLIPHHELFHRYETRRRVRKVSADPITTEASDAFLDIDLGDYVVHIDHGIAQFVGLKSMRRNNLTQEYLTLEFADKALLHVPATQIDLIQKYIGGFHGRPPLSKLGGKSWAKQKKNVADSVRDLAKQLLQVQAARETMPGIRYPNASAWMSEFEAEFPYDETEDQLAAMHAIKHDMSQDRPMDRLICGDVGFGKTELAIRAAFKAAEYGKQVAVLVPTTVLAEQHEITFKQRMADYPFRIESLSRFKTPKQSKRILTDLQLGQVDILIGTHRLLSKDIHFGDLGLVIIDEEQRFGVEHKNKLLQYRLTADVLTLSATPIPRTLHMSMIGLRDISSLSTAPVDRRSIVTEVIPFDRNRVKSAIIRELNRDGQIYFVHNRVQSIERMKDELQELVPDARIIIGHGQMAPRQLEQIMLAFMRHEYDILVATTIIESGIDIPTANTMFVNHADYFGLAQLHQLRGRVGRYKHRAYCYLLLPEERTVNETAAKRLKAIEQYSMLGAGFKIAMRDLEIRGAGNLLGSEQSGHIAAVGYEMYCLLLEHETKRLKNEPIIEPAKTHLELPITGSLPKRYISSDKYRMEAYRQISRASTLEQLEAVTQNLTDAYGPPPQQAQTLIDLTELRIAASTLEIDRLKLEADKDLIFTTHKVKNLENILTSAPGRVSVINPTTIYYRPPQNYLSPAATLLAVLRKLIVRPIRDAKSTT